MQGAQILRNEAYLQVRRNDEGCRATPQVDFLRSHQSFLDGSRMVCEFRTSGGENLFWI